jgi:hypothetical protein
VRPALFSAFVLALPWVATAKDPTPEPQSRSSQILGPHDMTKEFHMEQLSPFGRAGSTFRTKSADTQSFQFQQKFRPKGFEGPKEFRVKSWWGNGFRFSTKAADTKTFETKTAETKTAAVKDAPEAGKTAATKDLPDGNRPYLGPESKKLNKPVDPEKLPKLNNEMHELKTVEDIKELLNKNR